MAEIPSFRTSINGFHRGDVIEFIKKILDENAFLTEELSRAREKNTELQAEIENCRNQIEGFHTDRQNEQVLGRVMYDARRFSDELVREAVDRANGILSSAASAAEDVTAQVDVISEQASVFETYFTDSMSSVASQMSALLELLDAFRKDVAEKKTTFVMPEDVEPPKDETSPDTEETEPCDEAPTHEEAPETEEESTPAPVRLTVKKVKRSNGKK